MDDKFSGVPPVKPSVRIDFSGHGIIRLFSVKNIKCEAVCIQVIPRKPSRGYVGTAREPLTALDFMTNKESGRVTALNKTDGRRRPACMKNVGDVIDGPEIQFRIDPCR